MTNALIFVPPGKLISRSGVQHFLNNDLKMILDTRGVSELETKEVNIQSNQNHSSDEGVSQEQRERKNRSEKLLNSMEIKTNPNLPVIESSEESGLRTMEEIAQRTVILTITNLVAFNAIEASTALDILEKYNLKHLVTPKEHVFLNDPTEETKNHETWKCECIWTFMWALGYVEELGSPDQLADLNRIPSDAYPVRQGNDPNDFIRQNHQIRHKQEIMDANDLYYRIDWACVNARINGEQINGLHPGVVYERHYALNWLIRYMDQDWDNVSCNT